MHDSGAFTGWFPAAMTNAILPETAVRAIIRTDDIALWRGADGVARAWENRCPHRGMRLSYGVVRGNRLTCLYHGWTYDGDGGCAAIPAHPDVTPPKTIRARTYQCREIGGLVWVAPEAEGTPAPAVDGDWAPCRSLHIGRPVALSDVLAQIQGAEAAPFHMQAARVQTPCSAPAVLGVQPMAERGAMLHCTVPGTTPSETRRNVSEWLGSLRLTLERPTAA